MKPLLFAIALFVGLSRSANAAERTVPEAALKFVRKLLADPMMAPSARGVKFVFQHQEVNEGIRIAHYILPSLKAERSGPQNRCSFYMDDKGYDFSLSLINDDIPEVVDLFHKSSAAKPTSSINAVLKYFEAALSRNMMP